MDLQKILSTIDELQNRIADLENQVDRLESISEDYDARIMENEERVGTVEDAI